MRSKPRTGGQKNLLIEAEGGVKQKLSPKMPRNEAEANHHIHCRHERGLPYTVVARYQSSPTEVMVGGLDV
jgi:hypothetical protein